MPGSRLKSFLRSSVNLLPAGARGWVKHIPVVAGVQRWLVNRVLSSEPFVHTINAGPASGLHFEITLPQDKAIWAGTFEPVFAEELRRGIRPGDVCFDIGGYRGYMSGVMALASAKAVVVFEPLPDNVTAIERLVALNPALNISVCQVAVGRSDGRTSFTVMPDRSMGKLKGSSFQADVHGQASIDVELAQLDTLVYGRGLPKPTVMKIDVEGAEVDVLCGAQRVLAEGRPKLFIEAHSAALADECTRLLVPLGYSVTQIEAEELAPEATRHLVAFAGG